MENESPAVQTSKQPPEPENTGIVPNSQKSVVTPITVLSAEQKAGLQESNVSQLFTALLNQGGQQLRDVLEVVGGGIDRQAARAHETIERLQKDLRDEQVAHARTDQKLETVTQKDRIGAFLTALGGTLLGYGLSDLDHTPGKVFCGVGVVLLIVGNWPLMPWSKD